MALPVIPNGEATTLVWFSRSAHQRATEGGSASNAGCVSALPVSQDISPNAQDSQRLARGRLLGHNANLIE